MRTFDIAPFYRSTVGFDRLFDMLDESARPDWPPHDIEKTGENAYRVTMAVAGFGPDDVDVSQNGPQLLIVGRKQHPQDKPDLLHHGIAQRSFQQTFSLADHVRVVGADLRNGILSIDLVREVPKPLKPRKIEIGSARGPGAVQDNRQTRVDVAHRAPDAA